MPYIVKTFSSEDAGLGYLQLEVLSHRAVATLDEARDLAYEIACKATGVANAPILRRDANAIPSTGKSMRVPMTGTTIEVKPYSYGAMLAYIEDADGDTRFANYPNSTNAAEIIAAYNAAQ